MSRYVHTQGYILANDLLPEGSKFYSFEKEHDLKIGTEVYASLFAGKRRGVITEIIDEEIVLVDGKQTFISDIQYTIIN